MKDIFSGFFATGREQTKFYNRIHEQVETCDADIRPKLAKLFSELRRANREADKLLREQERKHQL